MRHIFFVPVVLLTVLMLPVSASADVIFHLDSPPEGATVAGLVSVHGWILDDGQECGPPPEWEECDWSEVLPSNIDLYVDGVFTASADLNIPRYDILQAYPWYAGTPFSRPGFATSFDADALVSGDHTLFIRVTFSDASVQDFGDRSFTVDGTLNQAPIGELELPGEGQPMNGVFPVTGWALDDGSIEDVEILIDGLVVGGAETGIHRPDIAHRYPWRPDAEHAGFVRMLNTSEIVNGVHMISVRLRDDEGATRVVGRRYVQTFNVGYNLPPFGGIDWPISNHTMFAIGCEDPGGWSAPPFDEPAAVSLVTGWALDVGASTDRGGVKWVELLINGSIQANTLIDDFYFNWFDMDVNYYGHERLDILRMFPDVPNAKDSGFAFALDISDLIINRGYHQGLHYLKIRAGDIEGNIADIAQIPVIFDCNDDPDRPAWGDIYTPTHMERVAGTFPITGWAIDYDKVNEVEVWVDGRFMGFGTYGLESPEVRDMYPWWPWSLTRNAGYYYDLDTTLLTDGEHVLVIRTRDFWRSSNFIGERTFVVDNLNKSVAR
jgi:hypothetical protein